jgi:hypothetical protein
MLFPVFDIGSYHILKGKISKYVDFSFFHYSDNEPIGYNEFQLLSRGCVINNYLSGEEWQSQNIILKTDIT